MTTFTLDQREFVLEIEGKHINDIHRISGLTEKNSMILLKMQEKRSSSTNLFQARYVYKGYQLPEWSVIWLVGNKQRVRKKISR